MNYYAEQSCPYYNNRLKGVHQVIPVSCDQFDQGLDKAAEKLEWERDRDFGGRKLFRYLLALQHETQKLSTVATNCHLN
jgi:hypothetical protein